MNFVKKSLVGGTRGEIRASGGVKALSLPASDLSAGLWGLASSFCSPVGSARGLLQGFHHTQDSGTIAIEF